MRHLAFFAVVAATTLLSIENVSGASADQRLAVLESTEVAEQPGDENKDERIALICFLTGEQISGLNKICFYDCLGSAAAITISAVSLCPLSINR